MPVYRFAAVVSEDGTVRIPDAGRFAHQKVEVVVIPKSRMAAKDVGGEEHPVDRFLRKWQGALKGIDADELKFRYLRDKYA